jgi:hypothetical protein
MTYYNYSHDQITRGKFQHPTGTPGYARCSVLWPRPGGLKASPLPDALERISLMWQIWALDSIGIYSTYIYIYIYILYVTYMSYIYYVTYIYIYIYVTHIHICNIYNQHWMHHGIRIRIRRETTDASSKLWGCTKTLKLRINMPKTYHKLSQVCRF